MAGAGYKLFNTGDVLTAAQVNTYLMEQTVMVFDDAAARTTALSGVVSEGMISYLKDTNAVEVYNGSAWVASDDPNAIQNTIVDAKGDLISASAADTPARLAVGSDGSTLVADSSASVGLSWSGQPAASNMVFNSAFDIWQRGTSFTTVGYTADRWRSDNRAARTRSRQTASLEGFQYCLRIQRDSGDTNTQTTGITQTLETVDSLKFQNKQITFSFWARKGANYSGGSDALGGYVWSGTGTDENRIIGASTLTGEVAVIDGTATLTTSWQRFTFTGTVGASINQIALGFIYTPSGTAGAADYFEVTGVQIDFGPVALPYRRMGNTLAGELAACQRYFQRRINSVATPEETVGVAQNYSTTQAFGSLNWMNTMRVAPTVSVSAVGDFAIRNATAGVVTLTAFTFDRISTNQCRFNTTVASGQVAGDAGLVAAIFANSATLDASAEL